MEKCEDCAFVNDDVVTGNLGLGLYYVHYCSRDLTNLFIVDPGAYRDCQYHTKREGKNAVQGSVQKVSDTTL